MKKIIGWLLVIFPTILFAFTLVFFLYSINSILSGNAGEGNSLIFISQVSGVLLLVFVFLFFLGYKLIKSL